MEKKTKDRILILSVDRDDDVGRKTSHKGPVMGREKVLSVANALGLADPEDSDFNALFQAVRYFDEMKKQFPAAWRACCLKAISEMSQLSIASTTLEWISKLGLKRGVTER